MFVAKQLDNRHNDKSGPRLMTKFILYVQNSPFDEKHTFIENFNELGLVVILR